jgi:hypothetical protein
MMVNSLVLANDIEAENEIESAWASGQREPLA